MTQKKMPGPEGSSLLSGTGKPFGTVARNYQRLSWRYGTRLGSRWWACFWTWWKVMNVKFFSNLQRVGKGINWPRDLSNLTLVPTIAQKSFNSSLFSSIRSRKPTASTSTSISQPIYCFSILLIGSAPLIDSDVLSYTNRVRVTMSSMHSVHKINIASVWCRIFKASLFSKNINACIR